MYTSIYLYDILINTHTHTHTHTLTHSLTHIHTIGDEGPSRSRDHGKSAGDDAGAMLLIP